MRTRNRLSVGLGLLLAAALVAGCASPVEYAGDRPALSSWLLRTTGVVSVFPPREDVRVGDVHIYLRDPEGSDPLPLYAMPRWSNLPSSELLAAAYRLRPEYPATPTEYLNAGGPLRERPWSGSTGEPGFLEPGAPIDRLRAIQLPGFVLYPEDIGEPPPSWGFHMALDESFEDWRLVRIRIESAETAGLPLEDSLRAYLEKRESGYYLPESLRQNMSALAPDDLGPIWVRIVTEVIYMRAMQVTVVAESGFDLTDDDVSEAELGDYDEKEGQTEPDDEDLDPKFASIARATALNRELMESGTDVLPDGFIRFINVSEDVVTARRVYRRGIAIGVGGLSLKVNPQTGAVEHMRLIGRDIPGRRRPAEEPSEDPELEDSPTEPSEQQPVAPDEAG